MQAMLDSTPEPLPEHDSASKPLPAERESMPEPPLQPPHLLEDANPRERKIEWADLHGFRTMQPGSFAVHLSALCAYTFCV